MPQLVLLALFWLPQVRSVGWIEQVSSVQPTVCNVSGTVMGWELQNQKMIVWESSPWHMGQRERADVLG